MVQVSERTNERRKKRREILYDESPYCRNCGSHTIMDPALTQTILGGTIANCATIQHNLPRSHPNYHNDYTLWCYKCNNEDSINKQNNKIFSREELIHYLISGIAPLEGRYVVDGIVYLYEKHKLKSQQCVIEYKFERLREYMVHFIDRSFRFFHGRRKTDKPTFEEFCLIKGTFSFRKYYIGNGWYHYKVEVEKKPEPIKPEAPVIILSDIEKRMAELKEKHTYLK